MSKIRAPNLCARAPSTSDSFWGAKRAMCTWTSLKVSTLCRCVLYRSGRHHLHLPLVPGCAYVCTQRLEWWQNESFAILAINHWWQTILLWFKIPQQRHQNAPNVCVHTHTHDGIRRCHIFVRLVPYMYVIECVYVRVLAAPNANLPHSLLSLTHSHRIEPISFLSQHYNNYIREISSYMAIFPSLHPPSTHIADSVHILLLFLAS